MVSKIDQYYMDGDIDNLMVVIDDSFRLIKNKFVYPVGSMTASFKGKPARYVHKCDRKADCDCVALTSHLLHCMSSENAAIANETWSEEIQTKLDTYLYEPRLSMPFSSFVMWV